MSAPSVGQTATSDLTSDDERAAERIEALLVAVEQTDDKVRALDRLIDYVWPSVAAHEVEVMSDTTLPSPGPSRAVIRAHRP